MGGYHFLENSRITSVPDVFSICSFIPRAHFETSLVIVAMVTRYDVIRSRCSSQFWVKIHVFSTSFKNERKSWMKLDEVELRSPSFDRFPFLLYVHFNDFTAAGIRVS